MLVKIALIDLLVVNIPLMDFLFVNITLGKDHKHCKSTIDLWNENYIIYNITGTLSNGQAVTITFIDRMVVKITLFDGLVCKDNSHW